MWCVFMERRSCIWKNRIVLCCLVEFKPLLGIADGFVCVVIECGSQRCGVEFEALHVFFEAWRDLSFFAVLSNLKSCLGVLIRFFFKKTAMCCVDHPFLSNSKPSALICSETSRAVSIQLFEFRAFKNTKRSLRDKPTTFIHAHLILN